MSFLDSLHPAFRTPGGEEPNIAYFIARLGGEGELWAAEYTRPEHVELMAGANRALAALRARRIAEGRRELRAVEERFHQARGTASPGVHGILGRWYYGLLAYYLYRVEEYRGADEALDRGHEEVRRAIENKRFLLPYAVECYGFALQSIRVACEQRLWAEMWRRVETARKIVTGEHPCCELRDGTAIGLASVQAFYTGFEELTQQELQALLPVIDAEERKRRFRSSLSAVYLPPGFVIPYAPAPTGRAAEGR
jgi:hypothetical protein